MKKRTEAKQGIADFSNGKFYKEIGIKLAEVRLSRGWSMAALAGKTDIHVGKIRNMDAGKVISLETLASTLRAFELDPREFLPEHSGAIKELVPKTVDPAKLNQRAAVTVEKCGAELDKVTSKISRFAASTGLPAQTFPEFEEPEILGPTYEATSKVQILAAFGQRVRIARVLRGITHHELFIRSTVPINSLYVLELGLRNPTMETVYRVAKGLECPVTFLVPGIHDNPSGIQNLDFMAYAAETQQQILALEKVKYTINCLVAVSRLADS